MIKKLKRTLLIALAFCLTLGLAGFAAACEKEPETITYTVTVVCDDGAAPAGLKVQLYRASGVAAGEAKELEGGKAVFELPAATYTVALSGAALDDYDYSGATLTADSPSATITLKKISVAPPEEIAYTVTVVCADETVLAGLSVQLFREDGTAAGEAKALAGGKAEFRLAPAAYSVVLSGEGIERFEYSAAKVTAEAPDVTVTLTEKEPVEVTIDYTVTVTCEDSAVFIDLAAELYNEDGLLAAEAQKMPEGQATFRLPPAVYTLKLTGIALSSYEYPETTLTADAPNATVVLTRKSATGDGSEENPYLLEEIVNDYVIEDPPYVDQGTPWGPVYRMFIPVYYSYTAKKNGTYILSAETDYVNFNMEDGSGHSMISWYGSEVGKRERFTLTEGETYIFWVSVANENSETYKNGMPLTWKIEEEVLAEKISYSVTLTGEGLTSEELSGIYVQLLLPDGTPAGEEKAAEGGTVSFLLEEGTYTVKLSGEPLERYTYPETTLTAEAPSATISLTLKEAPPAEQGTEENPIVLETPVGDYRDVKLPMEETHFGPMSGYVYYTFTAKTSATYTLTTELDGLFFYLEDEDEHCLVEWYGDEKEATFSVTEGTVYRFWVGDVASEKTAVSFRIAESAAIPETVTYTVRLVSEALTEAQLSSLKVQLLAADGITFTEAKSPEAGVVSFSAAPGTYTVVITGDEMEHCIYEQTTLTAEATEVTVEIKAKEEEPQPQGDGSEESPYVLQTLEGFYTVRPSMLSGVYYTYTARETSTYTITTECAYVSFFIEDIVTWDSTGTRTKVFALTAGETYLIVVDDFGGNGREVSFTIAKGGEITEYNYTVTIVCEGLDDSRLTSLKVTIRDESGAEIATRTPIGGNKVTFTVVPGTYTVELSGDLLASYDYTSLTLTKENPEGTVTLTPKQGGGQTDDRWKGSGTVGDPYVIETLEGVYDGIKTTGNNHIFFIYTAQEDADYTFSTSIDNLYISLSAEVYVPSSGLPMQWYDTSLLKEKEFSVTRGGVYHLEVGDSEKANGTLSFSFTKKDAGEKTLTVRVTSRTPEYMGSVTVTEGPFARGEEVAVRVTAKAGYRLVLFKVNGSAVPLDPSGIYRFGITGNTTVQAFFTAEERGNGTIPYPALYGTYRGSLGTLVIAADGATLDGKSAQFTASESASTVFRNEFWFTLAVGGKSYSFVSDLEFGLAVVGLSEEINFERVIDFSDASRYDADGRSFVGSWRAANGETLTVSQNELVWSDAAGKAYDISVLPVYSYDEGLTLFYVYRNGESGSISGAKIYRLAFGESSDGLVLKGEGESFSFAKTGASAASIAEALPAKKRGE